MCNSPLAETIALLLLLLLLLLHAFPAKRLGASSRQAAVKGCHNPTLVGLARSKQDPINRGQGAQYLYRPPPAGDYSMQAHILITSASGQMQPLLRFLTSSCCRASALHGPAMSNLATNIETLQNQFIKAGIYEFYMSSKALPCMCTISKYNHASATMVPLGHRLVKMLSRLKQDSISQISPSFLAPIGTSCNQ